MIELFWGILNLVILTYFIIICFKVIKIVRENLGGIATLIFVLGLLSLLITPTEENNTFDFENENNENKEITQNKFTGFTLKEIELEENLASKLYTSIHFGDNNIERKLLKARTYRNGFTSGIDWEISHINVAKVNNDIYEYYVTGRKVWRILRIQIYSEHKVFNGQFALKKQNRLTNNRR